MGGDEYQVSRVGGAMRTKESERVIRWREKKRVHYREYMKAYMRKRRKQLKEAKDAGEEV